MQPALQRDQVAGVGEGLVGVALDEPAHEAVRQVRAEEQKQLPQRVEPSPGQQARLQDTSAGEHLGEA